MKFTWDQNKSIVNRRKHRVDFTLAEVVHRDPLHVVLYDRFENGEHRWHMIGAVGDGFRVLVVVFTHPDPADEDWIHVIGLREAEAHERKRYEEDDR